MSQRQSTDARLERAERVEREAAAVRANRRQADALERQATALELLLGLRMVEFDLAEDTPNHSVEALYEEAEMYGRGGNLNR